MKDQVQQFTAVEEWRLVADEVCKKHQILLPLIFARDRRKRVVAARHELFQRLHDELHLSLWRIGYLFGQRDHTSVLHGVRRHRAKIEAAV